MKKNDEKTPVMAFRVSRELMAEIEKFARSLGVSNGRAIRILVERGLEASNV